MKSLFALFAVTMSLGAAAETGTIKFYNPYKNLGFVTPDAGARDYFFHTTNIAEEFRQTLRHGCRVEFVLLESDSRFADNIRILECPPQE